MEFERLPAVDPWETYVPLTLDGFGGLMGCLFRSRLWKERSMVSCSFTRPALEILRLPSSSAIIQKIPALYDAGSAFLAYFYFDFRDTDKISRRNLLSSLLDQLSTHSDPCCGKLYDLYRAYDNGANPSDGALVQCLKDMLILLRQAPVYIILDALNDCPNTSVFRSPRGQVLELVKELDDLHLPCLRICVTSRPEVDIQDNLKSIVSHSVSLHDERGQKQDIVEYVRSMIFSDPVGAIKRWKNADKDLVFETLSKKADGM